MLFEKLLHYMVKSKAGVHQQGLTLKLGLNQVCLLIQLHQTLNLV